ncbi:MAG: hypothetical protein IJO65_01285 [Lachnospiraceae bacterium]|nr:hypothetical protein [Lachnospiraceae bacterium]
MKNFKNKMVFCTLYNSGYLDKGLVLYDSLSAVSNNFKLYVFAFDQKSYHILKDLEYPNLVPVSLEEFEDERLLTAKSNRTEQEYCWTCSSHTIKYVLEKKKEDNCTYIDADMLFYADPQILFDEIVESKCDVSIIEHRLSTNLENNRVLKLSGRFCIEFNTFFATENGLAILNWWCDRCIELCTATPDGVHFGDQKYLDDWEERFKGVHILQHLGAGVAPWNIAQYRLKKIENEKIYILHKRTRTLIPLVFYHFQAMKYLANGMVDIGVNMYPGYAEPKLCNVLYQNYINIVQKKQNWLKENYGLDLSKQYKEGFSKKTYFFADILGERTPFVILRKLWRMCIRKNRDYFSVK